MFSPPGNKSCCLIFFKNIVYFEKKFILPLQTSYSDNASFKIIIFSFARKSGHLEWNSPFVSLTLHLRRFPCYFNEKHIFKLFPLSSCQYVSTISEKKTACYRHFKNRHFIRVCTVGMDDQYGKNGARNIFSNYNQMRAYVECSPINKKKLYLIAFPSSNQRNFEDSGKVLAVSVFEF